MPLNRVRGEQIEGLGEDYVIVPLAKWADTDFWDVACMCAEAAFKKAGAHIKVTFDAQHVLVQEYHNLAAPLTVGSLAFRDVLVFLFCRDKVAVTNWHRQLYGAKELYFPVVIGLTPMQKAELVMSGRWKSKVLN